MGAKVTTKTGDAGTTRTLGGDIVPKSDIIIECSGWVDAARAQCALLRLRLLESDAKKYESETAFLWWLLHCFFLIGCEVNDPENSHPEYRPCPFDGAFLSRLEAEQERLLGCIELPNAFIVSAANALAGECDVLGTTVRTLERNLARLCGAHPNFDGKTILPFVNRLSDFCFVLARRLDEGEWRVVDYGVVKA